MAESVKQSVKGKLVEIFDTQQIKDNFSKREFVIEYSENPKYPELIKFELNNAKCSIIEQFGIGEEVTVNFNLRGRRYTNNQGVVQYFNTIQAWAISK